MLRGLIWAHRLTVYLINTLPSIQTYTPADWVPCHQDWHSQAHKPLIVASHNLNLLLRLTWDPRTHKYQYCRYQPFTRSLPAFVHSMPLHSPKVSHAKPQSSRHTHLWTYISTILHLAAGWKHHQVDNSSTFLIHAQYGWQASATWSQVLHSTMDIAPLR